MKPVRAPAKKHTVILRPMSGRGSDVVFRAEAADGIPATGQIEERTRGAFGHNSKMHPLQAENRFRIGTFNNGYRLAVIPDQDVDIRFLTSHFQVKDALRWAAILMGGAIALSILMNLLGMGGTPGG